MTSTVEPPEDSEQEPEVRDPGDRDRVRKGVEVTEKNIREGESE